MRLLICQLSPPALDQCCLAAALQTRLDTVEARGGLKVDLQAEGSENLTAVVRQELYQIAQEALNNALKHARAQSVRILLDFRGGKTRLEITDDGCSSARGSRAGRRPRTARDAGARAGWETLASKAHREKGQQFTSPCPSIKPHAEHQVSGT